ncbi:MAG: tail fiber domain-containing protein [Candidatus Accumulibacter meliphilus]|jgi:hypothetical protein|uniref:tail fiber domain-containing protein n=1 Tax=Candidatus Accumulibacter meliphilus TaxID=2211374 RepID=UPI002FC2ED4D
MEIKKLDRKALKSFFVKNAIPTEGNFKDLIDGMINAKDDGIVKLPDEPLSLQADGNATSQKKVINFYGNFADPKPAWTLSLNPRVDANDPATARPGWDIGDADGKSRLFIDQSTGNVGIGTSNPTASLEVSGRIKASDICFGSGGWARSNQGGSIELGDSLQAGVVPYIDFHYGTGSGQDFNMRIINNANGRLSIDGGNLVVVGAGSVGIGTDSPAGKLHVQTGGDGGWDKFVVKTTNRWGDGNNQYVTIGEGGASGIMLYNPHVVWYEQEARASIRMGRSGGVPSGHWWDIGVRGGNSFSIVNGHAGVTGLVIDAGGNVGIGTSDMKAKLNVNGGINMAAGGVLYSPGRMHIDGAEILFLLHKQGVIIGREWGGTGSLTVQGPLWAGSLLGVSDLRLKKDVGPLIQAPEDILKLRGVRFKWQDAAEDDPYAMGLVAQEVEEFFPEAVGTGPDGMKGINYSALIAPLIETLKQQQSQIGELRMEIEALRAL